MQLDILVAGICKSPKLRNSVVECLMIGLFVNRSDGRANFRLFIVLVSDAAYTDLSLKSALMRSIDCKAPLALTEKQYAECRDC